MRPSVIIADDDPFITQLLSEICDSERMDVRIAVDGEEVLAQLLESPPDLILLDIMMPKMNGFQVLEEMSCMPPMRDVAVIVISAVSDNEAIRKGYELGARDYFIKPFRVGELLSRLRTHLKAVTYKQLPGVPLDHEVGDERQISEELHRLLEKPKRAHLSLLCASLTGKEGAQVSHPVLYAMAKKLRLQVRGVDRLFMMPDQRFIFVLPSTTIRGVESLQERLGEQLLDMMQAENLTASFRSVWEKATVGPGAAPEGFVEKLLTECSDAGAKDLNLLMEAEEE